VKIKLDENLPERLVATLAALGHDIDTVRAERLNGQADPNVWSATQAAKRFLITQDLDFSDVRRYEALMSACFWCVWRGPAATTCSSAWSRYSKQRTSKIGADASSS
jgi:predicted nuclease of predicted toxin-antitoxin system